MVLSADDESAIHEVASAWERAWNRHDMRALSRLFTIDADFVNVFGAHWRGRQEIEVRHQERHDTRFKQTHWHTREVHATALSSDVAIAHIDWDRTGDLDVEGQPKGPIQGVFTWILVKHGKDWMIRAAQNTNVVPMPN